MHDLRRQALLESKKTVSKKAQSKQSTPAGSKHASPTGSRSASRARNGNLSDDDGNFSDTTQWSINSIDELIAFDDDEDGRTQEQWVDALNQRIDLICDRKRSSAHGREETLRGFIFDATRHYAKDVLQPKADELAKYLLKSVKSGVTEREVTYALKAVALLIITVPSETVFDAVYAPIRAVVTDAQHPTAKIAGINALGIATIYGGAARDTTEEVMDLFLEIVASDGEFVGEPDNADVVAAAIEEWGFLAAQLDDLSELTETAVDTFVDQLDSNSSHVQIAAGENIALLYEKGVREADDDESGEQVPGEEGPGTVEKYTIYRQKPLLVAKIDELSRASSKRVSKKDRKALHQIFADLSVTLEKPTRGPRYSKAQDEDGNEYGSRMKIFVKGNRRMIIDEWWKLHVLNGLKRLLQGGFLVHHELNEVVYESLQVDVEEDDD
ncbi:hypothetical protein K431DRAFT_308647 [Polychaeton citri CBS 116435]|uniref:Interferon-related developmental regulator N-terminal domain-containing protein n=1 Tax=Polychaeton citri CBS 116435 TaxID=1314669 RepID=A0A9P4UUY7_9PEZI|nr:hypothetical protein K431DRAFT_308647 [Polychaeton citri CBS 116435]